VSESGKQMPPVQSRTPVATLADDLVERLLEAGRRPRMCGWLCAIYRVSRRQYALSWFCCDDSGPPVTLLSCFCDHCTGFLCQTGMRTYDPFTRKGAVFENDDPASFATVHSAHPTSCFVKLLINMLPTANIILLTFCFPNLVVMSLAFCL
jgi:hypothetical protein